MKKILFKLIMPLFLIISCSGLKKIEKQLEGNWILNSVNNQPIDLNQNAAMAVFGGVFYPFEVVLNCMALYLTFQYASDHYDKLCSCCHERCSRFVVRRASKDILRRHSREITTIDLHRSIPDEK